MEHLEVFAPKLRRITIDGSSVLRTISIKSEKLNVLEVYNCDDLDMRTFRETLSCNPSIVSLKLGRLSQRDLYLDECCCPGIQELSLLADFGCSTLHIRSPTLRLIHTESESDLHTLTHIYVMADHLCKVALVGVPALRSLNIQCASVDAIELNLCSDDELCLESCVIQAFASIGFLRLFDCKVDMLAVMTPLARTIVLYRCQMSDYALQMALTGCPNIAHLNLEKCRSLKQVSIQAPPMKYLNMFGCYDMNRLDVDCPELLALNIGHCPNVRLFLQGIERTLEKESKDIQIVLPNKSVRWTHDLPPKVYFCG